MHQKYLKLRLPWWEIDTNEQLVQLEGYIVQPCYKLCWDLLSYFLTHHRAPKTVLVVAAVALQMDQLLVAAEIPRRCLRKENTMFCYPAYMIAHMYIYILYTNIYIYIICIIRSDSMRTYQNNIQHVLFKLQTKSDLLFLALSLLYGYWLCFDIF